MPNDCMSDARELGRTWQAVLGRLEIELSPQSYLTWLKGTRAASIENGTLIVEAKTAFAADQLNEQFSVVVVRALGHVLAGDDLAVRFVPRRAEEGAPPLLRGERRAACAEGSIIGELNARYTFARYLPAEGNRLAMECCASLIGERELRISPVVIYGAPGMGKTHLLHALAREACEAGLGVACLNAEEFATRYIGSMRRGQVEDFQETLRSVRLLLIDDLQYLAHKKGTLDELVHTIDAVTNRGGHVVAAGERHPAEMDLPERLASRLAEGVVTRIEPFGCDERRAFIDRMAAEQGAALPAWAVERIALAEVPSVRALVGAVNKALMLQRVGQLELRRLDAELTLISVAEAAAGMSDEALLDLAARHFQLSTAELQGPSRRPAVTEARAATAAALKARGRTNARIGELLGRDRTSIPGLARRGLELLGNDAALRARLG
ncbi:MAG: DnaA ATPase domain-containing protein [Tepidiformaceae bacterium]